MATTAEVQALIDASAASVIDINETILVSDLSYLNLKDKTLRLFADPGFTINGRHWTILGGKLQAQTGDLFNCVNSGMGLIQNVWCSGLMMSKSLWKCIGAGQCYDTHVIGGEWSKPSNMTTPIVLVEVPGPFYNNNSFSKMRFQTNGTPAAPCIRLTCTHTANWLYGNAFQDINFEIPNAGAIHLESCFGSTLRGIQIFDADLFGPITQTIVRCGRLSTAHLPSTMTVIEQYFRLSGTMQAHAFDIDAGAGQHMVYTMRIASIHGIQGALVRIRLAEQMFDMNPNLNVTVVVT